MADALNNGPVVTLGETMGLLYADRTGPLAQTSEMRLSIGGAESNVTIGLARLGTRSAWIGRVGNDSIGQRIQRELNAEGVKSHVVVDPCAPTGLMIRERRTSESTHVWYYRDRSAGSRLNPLDIPHELISSASILHITGITPALSESARSTVFLAIEVARSAHVRISFDVNHRSKLWPSEEAHAIYRRIAQASDIVFAGEDEARVLTPNRNSPAELAQAIAELGPQQVVVKLGADGCVASVSGEVYQEPAIPISAVDTVGAGDAFVAGYLSEWVAGEDIKTRLQTATRAGAFQCLTIGDWEGLPRRDELSLLTAAEPVTR